jgi:integral membrane protein (TIGR00529 family)
VLIVFRLALIVLLLVLLIRLKLNLALAIIIAALWIGIAFRMSLLGILKVFPVTLVQTTTLEYLLIIYFVLLLASLLKESGHLDNTARSLAGVVKDHRLGITLMPALIGLLPMPGGAMLSAPIVKEVGAKPGFAPDKLTFINYWFRHLWEYFWPLYPALLLTAGLFNVTIRDIMVTQFPLSLVAIATGAVFMSRQVRLPQDGSRSDFRQLFRMIRFMWPILLVIVLVLVIKLPMTIALAAGCVAALIGVRLKPSRILRLFVKALSISTLGVIYSVFLFKNMLEASSALANIPPIAAGAVVLKVLVVFLAPFLVGFLTGVNTAYAGIAFPIILPWIGGGPSILTWIMFAYASGFVGVLLSPVHLCLCLTKEFFGAEFPMVYRYLLPAVAVVLAAALVLLVVRLLLHV